MASWLRFLPRETKFFDLFAELSTAMSEGARLLRSILEDPYDLEKRVKQMQDIEHRRRQGDARHHQQVEHNLYLLRPLTAKIFTASRPHSTMCSTS